MNLVLRLSIASSLIVLSVPCCASDALPFPIDESGYFSIPTQIEVCTARKKLFGYVVGTPLPRQSKGIVLVEGTLLYARRISGNKQELSLMVDRPLLKEEEQLPSEISILSPVEKLGGISVYIGEKYRMAIFLLSGKYYTWAALGSAPMDKTLVGYYHCNDLTTPSGN